MEDPVLALDVQFLKQDVNVLRKEYDLLFNSYIELTADYLALHGLVIKVAQAANMDTDEILDTMESEKKKYRSSLNQKIERERAEIRKSQ